MAVAWPDFSLATITEAKYYDALKAAVAERCAAACAGAGHAFFFPASDQWCDATPDLNRLKELRNAIRSLAPAFVNFENEGYQWQAWSRFPIAYTAADVMGGEHSLAILPTPGSPESNAELLAVYRAFLENCAWWLKRFRYVDVSGQSYYTRKSEANGSYNWAQYSDGEISESGDQPEAVMSNPSHQGMGRRGWAATSNLVDVSHREYEHLEDWHSRDDGWHFDYEHYRARSVSATAYSGLVVRNFSGLPGMLLLVPCYTRDARGEYPTRYKWTDLIDSVMPDDPWEDDGGRMAESMTDTETREEKHGNAWLEVLRDTEKCRQWWVQQSEWSWRLDKEGSQTLTRTEWSLDGTRHYSETTTDETHSWTNTTIWEITENTINDFDGFGGWTLGVPVPHGIIQPHDRVTAIPERDTIPLPDVWNLESFRLWRRGLHPRDRSDTVSYQAALRIAPILDFNSSYRYQDT